MAFINKGRAQGWPILRLNLGGGFGIRYKNEVPFSLPDLAQNLSQLLQGQNLTLLFEPGRSIVGSAGILFTTVQYVKESGGKTFVIVDAGMHQLIRPALYQGWHKIWPINQAENLDELIDCDVVGPICETSDFLAKDRPLPTVKQGDVLAVFSAGAYGMAMASNYNSHPRPAEVLVIGDSYRLIRQRECYADLLAVERI